MAEGPPVIRMTADEINCLVYAFLVDSGFKHTAFSLCMEGRLENSPNFSKHIPRGELIDLLSKSLLYREVESHWKADHLALNCKAGFSLLEAHVCSLDPPKPKSVPLSLTYTQWPLGHFQPQRCDDRRKTQSQSDICPADSETNPNAILILPNETEVFVCGFNPANQSILVTGSKDAVLTLWDLPNPPLPGSAEFAQPPGAPRRLEFGGSEHCDLTALHWNAQGTLVAVGSYDSVLRICSVSGELYFSHTQHEGNHFCIILTYKASTLIAWKGPIFAVRFSKDGKWLLTASLDNTVCLWDVNAKELNAQYRTHTDCCLDIDWLSDILFGTCSADHLIRIMQVGKAEPLKTFSCVAKFCSIPHGSFQLALQSKHSGHTHEVNQIKSNPSATRLASCSDDMTARIWRLDDISAAGEVISGVGEPHVVLSGHSNSVSTIGWCPNTPAGTNEIVATAAFDATCRLWDSVTGECLKTFEDHKRPVYALKFNPTGRWLATGSGDGCCTSTMSRYERGMRWSWFAGYEKPGVFEIDWQTSDNLDRIALAWSGTLLLLMFRSSPRCRENR
ncbi:WD40 repeat-like protein, partial [Mycena olivaceomarginata]